jgi:hypothetical protein
MMVAAVIDLSIEQVKNYLAEYFDLNAKGEFIWKKSPSARVVVGNVAGVMRRGYRVLTIRGKKYPAHRLVWLAHNGSYPLSFIDHCNGIKDDNRIENLRDVSNAVNMQNRQGRANSNTTSGVLGVYWGKNVNKWIATIKVNYKKIHLGCFKLLEHAVEARKAAENKYFSLPLVVGV